MIYLLVRLHLSQMFRVDAQVREVDIPFAIEILIASDSPTEVDLRHISHDVICTLYLG